MTTDLRITVNGLTLDNPFIIGSGPPSANARVICKAFAAGWGGVVAKTTSLTDTEVVNVSPRYGKLRSPHGDIIGFENIELISDRPLEEWEDDFRQVKKEYPDKILIASIMESYDKSRWQQVARRCAATGVDAIELNFSCPHGHPETGMGAAMGQDPQRVREVTRWVVEAVGVPVWAKMTPNIIDITLPGKAAIAGGAQGVSAINTILSVIGVDLKTLRPLPTVEGHSIPGGYSALAIKPIALRMILALSQALAPHPVSGIGGICDSRDALEMLLLGAATVQVCTGVMLRGPDMIDELKDGLAKFLSEHGFASVRDMVGKSLPYFTSHHHLVDLQARKKAAKTHARASLDRQWGEERMAEQTARMTSNEEDGQT